MIDIIIGGCSFTHNENSWAEHLAKHYEKDSVSVTNVAQGGVGQEHIVRSCLVALQKSKNKKICIAQFSGFSRMEVIVDQKERPELYSSIKSDKGYLKTDKQQSNAYAETKMRFAGLVEGRQWENHYNDSIILLRTTDIEGGLTWYQVKTTAGKILDKYNQTVGLDQRKMLSYEHIASLQWYCKLNDIPLFCFWGWDEYGMDPHNKEVVNASRDLVDWDNFWLYDETGGMAEWMIAQGHHGCLDEDDINDPPKGWRFDLVKGKKIMIGHPTPEAHKDFCGQIIVPWVKERLLDD